MHIRKEEIMKLKKKSGLISAVIALSCASLVSVGFASWVISQGSEETLSGTIVADSVDNKVHTLTLAWVTNASGSANLGSNPVVTYGHPETMNASGAWLTATGDKVENLVFYLKVTCTNVNAETSIASVIPTNPTVVSTAGQYASAASENLVGALPTATTAATNFDANGSFVYTITFTWGSAFGSQNPYNYYNDGTKTATSHGAEAASKLGNLNTYLTGATFGITVTAI